MTRRIEGDGRGIGSLRLHDKGPGRVPWPRSDSDSDTANTTLYEPDIAVCSDFGRGGGVAAIASGLNGGIGRAAGGARTGDQRTERRAVQGPGLAPDNGPVAVRQLPRGPPPTDPVLLCLERVPTARQERSDQ
jgi:hypothetical protein